MAAVGTIFALRAGGRALAAARRCAALLLLAVLAGCGGGAEREAAERPGKILVRVITPDLWAGAAQPGGLQPGVLPAIEVKSSGGPSIQGPIEVEDTAGGGRVWAYLRTTEGAGGQRLQLLTLTQGGAGLGRIRDVTTGLPERRFAGDVVFPLGPWRQGEIRQFEATEFTLAGPALRRLTLEILDLDFVHRGVAHSLAYRLTTRDAAARVIGCETSVYSPGAGRVSFEASSGWSMSAGCSACPCPR
jgi:hypothetical protein